MTESVEKKFSEQGKHACAIATQLNGKMTRLEVKMSWTMPSNSAHGMQFDVVADGPYWNKPLSGGPEYIAANKPLVLVEALESLAVAARAVYERAMAEGTEQA